MDSKNVPALNGRATTPAFVLRDVKQNIPMTFPFMTLLLYKSDNRVIIITGLLFFKREFRAHASTCVGQQIPVQPAALGHTQQNSNFTLNRNDAVCLTNDRA